MSSSVIEISSKDSTLAILVDRDGRYWIGDYMSMFDNYFFYRGYWDDLEEAREELNSLVRNLQSCL